MHPESCVCSSCVNMDEPYWVTKRRLNPPGQWWVEENGRWKLVQMRDGRVGQVPGSKVLSTPPSGVDLG